MGEGVPGQTQEGVTSLAGQLYMYSYDLFAKSTPNFAKSSKIQPSPSQADQRKKLGFPWILLAEMSLFKGLR
jgi:hypothetical protein